MSRPVPALSPIEEVLVTRQTSDAAIDLLRAAPDAIVGVGPDGRIHEANAQAERLFGYGPGELVGQPVEMLLPQSARNIHPRHRAAYLIDGQPRPMGAGLDLSGCRKDGLEFPAEISLSSADTPAGRLVWAFVRDVSDRQRAKIALQDKNRELEAANRELESFSYSVSHDLRAPIRAISGFCGILLEEHTGALDDEGRRLLGVVVSNAERMADLIEGLLAFCRAGKELNRCAVDLTVIARSVVDDLLASQPDRQIAVEVGTLPEVWGDAGSLRQVMVNLITNAFKFTRPQPDPHVEIGCRQRGADAEVFVRDNGVGFDMRHVNKLFGVFERLHGRADFEGTGIGLAIVARIVGRHGGEVWANATPGGGATFHLKLPLAPASG
jgi:PAS domain S-box-containing protein